MRAIRWNKRYLIGDPELDQRNRALVSLVADLHAELSSAGHCQEINELAERLADLAKQRFSKLPEDPGVRGESEVAIRDLLKHDFPLASLSTPACRDCGLCDLMSDRVRQWLSAGDDAPGDPPACNFSITRRSGARRCARADRVAWRVVGAQR